ncbi:hypothetical protein EST38_g8659 [Candolleomyces aberdarensis]|uniref:Ubiquitin-like protease family profile domain-containing protein n=1 Tax=Candolleomyces aberdarensis TaxID=2316362 RepID=A0A4Q2DC41_9AGAR|nr:hypothetical protein EST38_g8659 [Candolleomyces aberdarensis]
MPNNIQNQRRHKPYAGTFGQRHESPKKRRSYIKEKKLKPPLGFSRRQEALLDKLKRCGKRNKPTEIDVLEETDSDGDGDEYEDVAEYEATLGKPLDLPTKITPNCTKKCTRKTYQIECLYYDHAAKKDVSFCACEGVVPVLIRHGLFPGAPSQPRIAISIALLDFYQALFERSCDAVNALGEVDAIGTHISSVRKKPAKSRKIIVPDEAIDECEEGHIAGTGTKVKTDPERYDDTGTMALVCRHDIPILLANIDTPGEQQKYAVALIQKLYSMLPPTATTAAFYDVGCVLDRSLQLYNILPESITNRMTFATSVMHSYVHQWACQLAYNPRFRDGLGLSDGEGVERYWSRMRKIIGVCRTSGRTRRLWLIDRLTARIGADSRDNLGNWMIRRFNDLDNRTAKHKLKMIECGIPESELRQLWKEQREAQLSIRAHAPSKLKKELDKLIAIQGDLDRIENTIKEATAALGSGPNMVSPLKDLTAVYEQLSNKLDALYASLNIIDSFPALRGLPFDVVHKLLLARDLKINIRKRAIGSFFENERLEQASGGRNVSLGTKEHQRVRTAIEKRKPPFLSAIRRFNKLCAELKELLKPEWDIPVPEPLPTDIHKLRTKSHLMEDVWIERSVGETPKWIENPDVREGIRAMLSLDRCREERVRLGKEADNMCQWFGEELTKAELAIADPKNVHIRKHLEAYRTRLLLCEPKWSGSPAVSKIRYQHHIDSARQKAELVFGTSQSGLQPTWLPVMEHDTRIVDFSQTTFADDASDSGEEGPGLEDDGTSGNAYPGNDPDAADLPDAGEFSLRDFLEEAAEGCEDDTQKSSTPVIHWVPPAPLSVDVWLVDSLRSPFINDPPPHHQFRYAKAREDTYNGCIEFCPKSLDRLSRPSERLDDVCVNSGSLLLQYIFSHERFELPHSQACAIFSSFHIHLSRYNHSTTEVWRRTKGVSYWEKSIWLLPIHRNEPSKHWVLCIIYPGYRQLYLYDSLASDISAWEEEIKVRA